MNTFGMQPRSSKQIGPRNLVLSAGWSPERIGRNIRDLAARLVTREVWAIGASAASVDTLIQGGGILPAPRWLPSPLSRQFYADPFPVIVDGAIYVLAEIWCSRAGRGWIAACQLDGEGKVGLFEKITDLNLGCHASYPAVFQYDGKIYCSPEMWERGGLHLFRMGRTIKDWTLVARLLDHVPIVDPTIFCYEGRWWLLATIRNRAPNADLHAWYAPTPFGPWIPHPMNPIKSDLCSARPAGRIFWHDGTLYRPSQDCSTGYGAAVVLNQIIRLDPLGFEELERARLAAQPDWKYPHGLHTLNVQGDLIIFDAKRLVFDPLSPLWAFIPPWRRLRRLTRKRPLYPPWEVIV